jgi:hypothetical protein
MAGPLLVWFTAGWVPALIGGTLVFTLLPFLLPLSRLRGQPFRRVATPYGAFTLGATIFVIVINAVLTPYSGGAGVCQAGLLPLQLTLLAFGAYAAQRLSAPPIQVVAQVLLIALGAGLVALIAGTVSYYLMPKHIDMRTLAFIKGNISGLEFMQTYRASSLGRSFYPLLPTILGGTLASAVIGLSFLRFQRQSASKAVALQG